MSICLAVQGEYPARLFRFVNSMELPPGVIVNFYKEKNLLVINREEFELLNKYEKREVLRTTTSITLHT
jgi:hypothetical protein